MNFLNSKNLKNQFKLGRVNGQEIIAYFEGGKITSNAGIILIAELDKKLKITDKFVKCFP